MTRASIRYVLNGKVNELHDVNPTMTVLDYLRDRELRKGTKEGCAEGDCGTCTVAVGRLENGVLRYRSVNACIQFLPTLDGCHLLTVEDLRAPDGSLHPVQQSLVDTHGSQCGFCTPGFVMSMYVLWLSTTRPSRREIEDALAGNLCRCTGYGPIVDAMEKAAASPRIQEQSGKILELLNAIRPVDNVALESESGLYFAPTEIDDLANVLARHPDATILAGGTDVGLWVTKQHRLLPKIVYTGNVDELCTIEETDDGYSVGASVRYSDLPESLSLAYPDFGRMLRRLGSLQVRNLGTMGGNIANGSPIGDTPPLLIAMNTRIVLNRAGVRREIPLEDFFVDYGKQDLAAGEFLERIVIPKPRPDSRFAAYKISKRFDQDISAVCGAAQLQLNAGVVADARIAFGGMAAIPKRARKAEAALVGRRWTQGSAEDAARALGDDFAPITDMRASDAYRQIVAANLLRKMFQESRRDTAETRVLTY